MSRAKEEMRSEMAMRMIAVFITKMLSRVWFGTKTLPSLSGMDWKK
jgi:hypothetical protein